MSLSVLPIFSSKSFIVYGLTFRSLIPFEFIFVGFPGGSDGKEFACNGETWVQSLGWEDPLKKRMATHSSIRA